jgi:hypothetical protein
MGSLHGGRFGELTPNLAAGVRRNKAELGGDFAEGTVYFVMRTGDLAARDVARVPVIQQQT